MLIYYYTDNRLFITHTNSKAWLSLFCYVNRNRDSVYSDISLLK